MKECNRCGSYAVNPGRSGRDETSDLDLCDVCYWRKRAEQAAEIEREACAAIAAKAGDDLDASGEGLLPCEAAYRVESAIRARGAKGGE